MLNGAQTQAVRTAGNCLITACPGSGKTTVLTHRGEHLLRLHPGSKLLGVTFTSEAAKELGQRILARVPDAGNRVICGTFHSLCKRQIEQSGQRVKIVNEIQQSELVRRAFFDVAKPGDGLTLDAVTAFIETTKSSLHPAMPSHLDPRVQAYEAYQERLRLIGAYDFSDLLVIAARGVVDGSIAPYPVDFILADEYQDSDEVQSAWLHAHVRHGIEVCVVGDDDQSIYGWRFAQGYRALENFRRDAKASHVALNLTYRCAPAIMEASARLITHNAERITKTLQTAITNERGDVHTVRKGTRVEEFAACENAIRQSGRPGDWGVLARTNAILNAFEENVAIPVNRIGGPSFWDIRGPSLYLAVCRSLTTGDMDGVDQVLRRIQLNDAQIEEMHRKYRSHEAGAVARFVADKDPPKSKTPLSIFRYNMRQWMQMAPRGGVDLKLTLTGIASFIKEHVCLYDRKRDEDEQRLDLHRVDSCAKTLKAFRGPLENRIRHLEAHDKDTQKKDRPKVMTLHASKGLEFPHVWILGCEEGCIPSAGSPVDEERRLMYVGMTRAKSTLRLSYVNKKDPPSRFLSEAGLPLN